MSHRVDVHTCPVGPDSCVLILHGKAAEGLPAVILSHFATLTKYVVCVDVVFQTNKGSETIETRENEKKNY